MIRVTVLCDNIVGVPLGVGEHGFSGFVETETEAISSIRSAVLASSPTPWPSERT